MDEKIVRTRIKTKDFFISSWAPTGEPSSEVHMRFSTDFGEIIVAIKTRNMLDQIVQALQDHGNEVFGSQSKGGEK